MKMVRKIHSLVAQDCGAQIADFAAVLPMLVMLIFGILWFGRDFNIYTTVNHAAQAAAEASALHTSASLGNIPSPIDIRNQVVNPIFLAAHLDPNQITNYGIDPIIVNSSSTPQFNGFQAHLSYPYNFKLNGLTCCPPALTPVTLGVVINGQAQAKEEN